MKKNTNIENQRIKSRQGTERDKRRKVKGQRNCQAIRNSVKETVSLLLKNKSYCPSENDSITTSLVESLFTHVTDVEFPRALETTLQELSFQNIFLYRHPKSY